MDNRLIAIKKVRRLPFAEYRDGPCTAKAEARLGLPLTTVTVVPPTPPIPPKPSVTFPPEWIAGSQKRKPGN